MATINKAARRMKRAEKARLRYVKCVNKRGEDHKRCARILSRLTKREQRLIETQTKLAEKRGYFTENEVQTMNIGGFRSVPDGPMSTSGMAAITSTIEDIEIDAYPEEPESNVLTYVASAAVLGGFATVGYFAWRRATGRS